MATCAQFVEQRRAEFRATAAAVLHEIKRQGAQDSYIGPVNDRTTVALTCDQTRPCQQADMRRKGIVRHGQRPRQIPRCQPIRLMVHQQPKGRQPRGLCQSGKSQND